MDRLLKTRDITVRFGDHVVLDHISADFHAGVMTAVIGSNVSVRRPILRPLPGSSTVGVRSSFMKKA